MITAWIKELMVEPLTWQLIIQQLAGSANEIYTDSEGETARGQGEELAFFLMGFLQDMYIYVIRSNAYPLEMLCSITWQIDGR